MRLFAKLPDGALVSRCTHHKYTHVVAVQDAAGKWIASSWTSRPARHRNKSGAVLVPVEPS
jgi:hypothetical protein